MKKSSLVSCCQCFDSRGAGIAKSAFEFGQESELVKMDAAVSTLEPIAEITHLGCKIFWEPGNWLQRKMWSPVALYDTIKKFRPDIVHIHGVWTGALLQVEAIKKLGSKVVISIHGHLEDSAQNHNRIQKYFTKHWFIKKALLSANAIHVLSEHEKELFKQFTGKSHNFIKVSNGVKIQNNIIVEKNVNRVVRFLYLGRFHKNKNLISLIHAWNQANVSSNAELHLVGYQDDEYSKKVNALAKCSKGVFVKNFMSENDKSIELEKSDFGILLSLGEGQPLGILESWSYGKPCVISKKCRLESVEDNGLGWVVEDANSTHEISSAIISAIQSIKNKTYSDMARNCHSYIQKNHNWSVNREFLHESFVKMSSKNFTEKKISSHASIQ